MQWNIIILLFLDQFWSSQVDKQKNMGGNPIEADPASLDNPR